jgi:hypothetical protein
MSSVRHYAVITAVADIPSPPPEAWRESTDCAG